MVAKANGPLIVNNWVIVNGELVLLESVAVAAALVVFTVVSGNASGFGDRLTVEAVPAPLKLTVIVLLLDGVIFREAVSVPVVVGVNVTLIVQVAPAAMLVPQLSSAKSPLSGPATVILLIVTTEFVPFFTVTV